MAGEGDTFEDAKNSAGEDPTIHFLGFVNKVHGLYAMADVALLPSRYAGESFPLTLIQAFQMGIPCIATDIGEIKRMSEVGARAAGIIFAPTDDNESFIQDLSVAMETMLDHSTRSLLSENAASVGKSFNINELALEYLREYLALIDDYVPN
jgi:glycosyltransferase involved in cell wall biosynthesis